MNYIRDGGSHATSFYEKYSNFLDTKSHSDVVRDNSFPVRNRKQSRAVNPLSGCRVSKQERTVDIRSYLTRIRRADLFC